VLQPPLRSPGKALKDILSQGTAILPGVFNALSAVTAQEQGARALYMSGGATTNALLGMPDIALMTLSEFADQASKICQVVQIPVISDADTGFGEGWNVARTVVEMERAGLAGIHLEDQVSPKRCGHLEGKQLIEPSHMSAKIRAAVEHKRDPNFWIIARTDARGVDGLEAATDRAKLYVDSGADAIFPEGLESASEFETFRRQVSGPLLANMTEFGKTPLISAKQFGEMGYEMVIFPVTALRVALFSLQSLYRDLVADGTQAGWMDRMVTRKQLYETIDYDEYTKRDARWQ